MGKHKNATKGGEDAQKGASLLLHLMEGRQVTQVMQFTTWGMMWHHWRRHCLRWVLLPKCPFDLHYAADCSLNDLYHLSVYKITWYTKTGCAIVSSLEWLWGKGRWPAPTSHAWSGLLIADMFQDGLEEWITKAVVLVPGEAILFFGRRGS